MHNFLIYLLDNMSSIWITIAPLYPANEAKEHTILMARSLNQIQLIGRLGKRPDMRYTPNGKAVATFSMATDYEWKNAQGEPQKETTWHNIEAWGSLAEICNQYLDKGRLVFLQGRQVHQSYQDKQTNETKYFSKVIVSQMIMLGGNGNAEVVANGEPEEEESIDFSVA